MRDAESNETTGTADTQLMRAARDTIPSEPPERESLVHFAPGSNVHTIEEDMGDAPDAAEPERVSMSIEVMDRFIKAIHDARQDHESSAKRDKRLENIELMLMSMQEQVSRANSGITSFMLRGQPETASAELLGRHVLLVEDFAPLANAEESTLNRFGARTTLRGDYLAAVRWIDEAQVLDIAVLDIRLPDGDGIKLAARIRNRFPRCAIVLTSGALERHHKTQAADLRAGTLRKPHSHEQLLDAILDQLDAVRP